MLNENQCKQNCLPVHQCLQWITKLLQLSATDYALFT